jgi:peptide/nickel transport system ATP-binding protein
MLEAKNIAYGYKKGEEILRNISLSVQSGERLGIVAPSGFGKTTLCSILSGYVKARQGQVLLDGQDVYTIKGYCPVQMIWQHPEKSINPRLRLKETIAEGDCIDTRITDDLGIERDWFNRFPSELSGGELQRFCIARALGARTRFLIADEISTMLDMITQAQIWNFLLAEVERRQIGLVVVSHNALLLQKVVPRVMELDRIIR